MDKIDLGARLKKARLLKGLTANELAILVGFNNRTQISFIENNKRCIPQKKLPIFSEVLGVSIGYLLGEEDIEIKNITKEEKEEREKTQLKEELKEELLKEMVTLKKQEENADKWQINMRNALVELSEDEQNKIGEKLYEIALLLKDKKK